MLLERLGEIMIGRLVRDKYNNRIGIVLRRKITRTGTFRYHVFMDGRVQSINSCFLEVINENR